MLLSRFLAYFARVQVQKPDETKLAFRFEQPVGSGLDIIPLAILAVSYESGSNQWTVRLRKLDA